MTELETIRAGCLAQGFSPQHANGLAGQKEKLELTALKKPEKKQIEPEEKQADKSAEKTKSSPQSATQTKPDDSKSMPQSDTQTEADAKKSASQPPAQVTPEVNETTSQTLAQFAPEEDKAVVSPVAGGIFTGLMIASQAQSSQAESNEDRSYLLLFQYNIEEQLRFVSEWKILICSSPSDSFLT